MSAGEHRCMGSLGLTGGVEVQAVVCSGFSLSGWVVTADQDLLGVSWVLVAGRGFAAIVLPVRRAHK